MTTRGNQTITWDTENRPIFVSGNSAATFVYDGNGNRVKEIENGETILYVNKYYEKNLTTDNVTTYYYLGRKMVAIKKGSYLRYIQQDHLTSTSLVTSDSGAQVGTIKYYPFGECRKD